MEIATSIFKLRANASKGRKAPANRRLTGSVLRGGIAAALMWIASVGSCGLAVGGEVMGHEAWFRTWREGRTASGVREYYLDAVFAQVARYCRDIDAAVQRQIDAAQRCDRQASEKAIVEKLYLLAGLESFMECVDTNLQVIKEAKPWNGLGWRFRAFLKSSVKDPEAWADSLMDLTGESSPAFRNKRAADGSRQLEREEWDEKAQWSYKVKRRVYFDHDRGEWVDRSGFFPDNPVEDKEATVRAAEIVDICLQGINALLDALRPRLRRERDNLFDLKCAVPTRVEFHFGEANLREALELAEALGHTVSMDEMIERAGDALTPEEREMFREFDRDTKRFEEEQAERNKARAEKDAVAARAALDAIPDDELTAKMFEDLPAGVKAEILEEMAWIELQETSTGLLDMAVMDRYYRKLREIMDRNKKPDGAGDTRLSHATTGEQPFEDDLVAQVLEGVTAEDVLPRGIDPVFLSTIRNDYNNLRQGIYSSALLQRPMTETERKTAEYYLTEPFSVKAKAEEWLWTRGPCAEMGGYTPPPGGKGDIVRVVSPVAPDPAANQAYALRIKAEQGGLFEKYRRWSAAERLRRSLDPVNWMVPPKPGKSAPILEAPRPAVEGLGTPPRISIPRPKL